MWTAAPAAAKRAATVAPMPVAAAVTDTRLPRIEPGVSRSVIACLLVMVHVLRRRVVPAGLHEAARVQRERAAGEHEQRVDLHLGHLGVGGREP